MTLHEAVRAVIAGTAASGAAGAALGALLGKVAPNFFAGHGASSPVETGLALGAIAGLVLGAMGCVILAAVKIWSDARLEARRPPAGKE